MRPSTKATIIRMGIPLLRLASFYAGLWAVMMAELVLYAPPLQKLFYHRIVVCVWGCLALAPFALLRKFWAFHAYCVLLIGCLAFMAYDHFVPFRYVAPSFQESVQDPGGRYSISGNDDKINYWISHPTPPSVEDILMSIVYLSPLALAILYRRFYQLGARQR